MFRTWIPLFALALLVGCSAEKTTVAIPQNGRTEVSFQSASQSDDEKEQQAKTEYQALEAEFQAAVAELRDLVAKTDSKDEQVRLLATKNPAPASSEKFLAMARKYKGTKASVDATLFAVGQAKGETKNEAMTFLLENYAGKVKVSAIASSLKREVPHPAMEGWFDLMIKNAETDKDKASVMLTYSQYLGQFPTFKRTLELSPLVAQRLPQEQLDYIMTPRTDEQNKQHQAILEKLISDYGQIKYQGRTLFADVANSELIELTQLQVGMLAPEIEGEDLDEIPFKLSDYRGKVVMLDFWGHWCPPCRAMYPHEQEITKTLAEKPFVLLGVNSDGDKDTAIEAVRSESLSWRHFWNGKTGTRGPISSAWNVEGWPTVYLIDEKGVIRYKEVLGEDIDRGLEVLMAEMGHEVSLGDAE